MPRYDTGQSTLPESTGHSSHSKCNPASPAHRSRQDDKTQGHCNHGKGKRKQPVQNPAEIRAFNGFEQPEMSGSPGCGNGNISETSSVSCDIACSHCHRHRDESSVRPRIRETAGQHERMVPRWHITEYLSQPCDTLTNRPHTEDSKHVQPERTASGAEQHLESQIQRNIRECLLKHRR